MQRANWKKLVIFLFTIAVVVTAFPTKASQGDAYQALNVNSASKEQLMTLPGVGEKLAMRILSHREGRGHFASLDDLLLVKGIQPKLLSELSGKVEVGVQKSKRDNKDKGSEQKIDDLIKQFEKEPKIPELQARALQYASVEPARIEKWLNSSRIAPALPSLALSAGRALDSGESIREKFGDPLIKSTKDSSDFKVNLKVEWKFSDLVFNRNELFVARESFRMSVIRERILSDITKTYIQRRRELLKLAKNDPSTKIEKLEADLKIQELTAILDGLTGGWFSEALRNS